MLEISDRPINQRYAVVRLLGEGGMSWVYLVRDTWQKDRQVALKLLRPGGPHGGGAEQFRNEFRSMARLRHPNLAEVYDFGTVDGDGRHFLTMEYVKGEPLTRRDRAAVAARFDALAVQCLRALDYIHSRGLMHNDIKPQNIMIGAPFQVKLLDFGLATGQAETILGPSGTLHYIAPERFGERRVDGRSDLYSLGVVLYEMLTGLLPHEGGEAGQVVGAILRGQIRPPRSLDPSIEPRHEEFVMALLARDPSSRPADAAAALALLNRGLDEPLRLDTAETHASYIMSGRFVGRDVELDALMTLATEHTLGAVSGEGRPRLVLLSGPSGIGKTRLLRELKHRLQLAGVRNVTGRARAEGGAPFEPFVEVLRQLPSAGALPSALAPVVDQLLSAEGTSIAAPDAVEKLGKDEFIRGTAEALAHLAGESRGVVFLEDLHWSDGPDVDLLEHIVRQPSRGPWLYVGSLRDEEARGAPIGALLERLADHPGLRHVPLRPLDAMQVTEFLASMVPFEDRPEGLAKILLDRTAGNPLYLEEMMKTLAEDGTLRRHGRAWIAESRALDSIRLPPSLATALAARLSSLSGDERRVADLLAVFNRPVDIDLLTAATEMERDRVEQSVDTLVRLRLAAIDTGTGGRPLADLAHARVRDAVYEAIADDDRAAVHLAAGAAIEAAQGGAGEAAEELAYHFAAAGDAPRAADYSLRAAARARALYYAQRESRYLSQALHFLPAGDTERRLKALYDLICVQGTDLNDHPSAVSNARRLHAEARAAGNRRYEGTALRDAAWSLGFLGDFDTAVEEARRALALFRADGDRREEMACLNTLGTLHARHRENAAARDYFDEVLRLARETKSTDVYLFCSNNQGLNLLGLGETAAALALVEESIGVASEHRQAYSLHRTLSTLGAARYESGDVAGAIQATQETLEWAREHANREMMQQCLENLGLYYAQSARFTKALAVLDELRASRTESGDRAGLLVVLDYLGSIERDLGRPAAAAALHREGVELARVLEIPAQEGFLVSALAADHLDAGDGQAAEDAARQAMEIGKRAGSVRVQCRALCVLARAAALRDDRRAAAVYTRALGRLDAAPLRLHERVAINLAVGLCALAADKPADAEREAKAGLAIADRAGLREFQWRLNGLMGDSLAAKGLPYEATHFYNAARDCMQQISGEIEDNAMRKDYDNDESRRAVLGRADATFGIPTVSEGTAGTGKDDPVRMLTTIYQITQIINSILDLKELLEKVMDQAIALVQAERGLIFLYRSETDEMESVVARNIEHQTIKDATEYSRSVLREAGHGRSILSHDALADDRFREFRSVTAYNIRSLMCVPLKLKNRIIGTVYVDTRKPGVVFTESDLRFFEAFANQAAIAIENARLYEAQKQENTWLRAAVQERYGYENIVGRSPRMREIFTLLNRVAPTNIPVIIRGESGTGKELIARAIHQNSPRRDRRFFTENCAALPESLLESELFGHARGAFTGADASRKGLFELADGGTLFLDEVGDMSMPMQSKLLRVLQDGEFRPVGSETTRKVDVRVISATSRDLEAMIKGKTFRQDLYFRLKGMTINLPALRERREDIPLLADHFLAQVAAANKTRKLRIDRELNGVLSRYDWPGNVRELENEIQRLHLFASGDTLTLDDAHHDLEFMTKVTAPGTRGVDSGVTRDDIQRALTEANGNRDEAAKILGVSRATFFRKMKQHHVVQKTARPTKSA